MWSRTRTWLVAVLVLVLANGASACAPGTYSSGSVAPDPLRDGTLLHVINRGWSDVRVFVLAGSTPIRLGTVDGYSSRSLRLPRALRTSTLQFRVVPAGSDVGFTSPAVVLQRHRGVELHVENNLKYSSMVVR